MPINNKKLGALIRFLLLLSLAAVFVQAEPYSFGTISVALQAQETITISVDTIHPTGEVSPLVFGTNISHPGRVNGIPDRISSATEFNRALEKWYRYLPVVNRLGPTILRFPGGLNANGYIWTRAIGPAMERRPMSHNPGSPYPIIGTDEFLLFCEELGAEAMITVNINRASGDSMIKLAAFTESVYRKNSAIAADWVEYCNAPDNGSNPRGGVDWAEVRARNGHRDPYGVKYWELGNELQTMPLSWYANAVRIFSKEMKAVDPTIRVGVVAPLWGWPAEKVHAWFQRVGKDDTNDVDFWIQHSYSPGTSGKIHGFVLHGKGAAITVPLRLPKNDTVEIRLESMTNKGKARVRMSVPQAHAEVVRTIGKRMQEISLRADFEKGPFTLRLELLGGGPALFHHTAAWTDRRGGQGTVDLKDSPEIYELIVSGAIVSARRWWSPEERGDLPLYITEYNSLCEPFRGAPHQGFAYSLRDALNLGMYIQSFLRRGVPVATQWLLFGDMQGFGLIEGVARDPNHGGELGRSDPHPRPGFYMLKIYRDHLKGDLLPVKVTAPFFHIGLPSPYATMGTVDRVSLDIPYLQAVAAGEKDRKRVCIVVENLHPRSPLAGLIELKGFSPGPQAERYVLDGRHPWSNNEPETCPQGDCVSIQQATFPVPGPRFTCSFPPHSTTALVLFREGLDRVGPDPPRNLRARKTDSGFRLTWDAPTRQFRGGYRLYRSRFSFGPFRHVIQTIPGDRTEIVDMPPDRDIDYTYALRSFNALGEQSSFSNRVTLSYEGRAVIGGR